MAADCVTRLCTIPNPALRLFLFHAAGSSHLLFRGWQSAFPADWELCPVEAPGRGRLAGRPPAINADELAAFLLPELKPWLAAPFAFFGHSFGGLVAYDLALRLAAAGLPRPAWVGISARQAPQSAPRQQVLRQSLSSSELRRVLSGIGATPAAVLADAEMWALIERVLRADLRIAETWQPPVAHRLDTALSAFGASEDRITPPEWLQGWRQHGSPFIGLHIFSGGHFYFNDCLPALARQIVADVGAARAALQPA